MENEVKETGLIIYEGNKRKSNIFLKTKAILLVILSILVLFISFNIINIIKYYSEMSNFKSFDLKALNRKELIIQTIEFKKFLVQGTEGNGEYSDELQIYHISGSAEVSFTEMDKLKMNKNDSDFSNKILRLTYEKSDKEIPFDVEIVINEKDIQKVAALESKEVNFFGIKKDLIKPEMSEGEKLNSVRDELKKEFKAQIIGEKTKTDDLSKLDIYQTFLKRFSEIVKNNSDWETVEIEF